MKPKHHTKPSASVVVSSPTMNGKPVFTIDRKKILKANPAFAEKQLCDGWTFTAGDACVYSCCYCYVEGQFRLEPGMQVVKRQAGLPFDQIVVRRANAVKLLRAQLLDRHGRPRFVGPEEKGRVVYGSPLVDVAANLELTRETVELCRLILEFTDWDVRLLSKSSFLPRIAEGLKDEFGAKKRVIYGVSTGTLDDNLAAVIERGTAKVSRRLRSLHDLQNAGYRTFGMICPSLPQDDYHAFTREMADAIRVDQCEHVWAEVINLRGASFSRTAEALALAGRYGEVKKLAAVSGRGSKTAWEDYARATFEAHASCIPPERLRFLQYPTADSLPWWQERRSQGAVLLGANAEAK